MVKSESCSFLKNSNIDLMMILFSNSENEFFFLSYLLEHSFVNYQINNIILFLYNLYVIHL